MLRDLAFAYARTGREGLAALTAAERLAAIGERGDARRLTERARGLLEPGTPPWFRADDILASLPEEED
jgi:Putative Zn-dependent protease, contains TPR repeats